MFTVNFTQSMSQSILALHAKTDLGMSNFSIGILLASSGIGAFLGGQFSYVISNKIGISRSLTPSVAVTCPIFFIMGTTKSPIILSIATAVNAFFGLFASIQISSLRQKLVKSCHIGKVSSINMLIVFGFAILFGLG